jgi:predicted dehydrogenase
LKQILQNLSNGKTLISEVPCPKCDSGSILIASRNTLISAGTEKMLLDFGTASLFNKARQQPEKVKMVLDKIRSDGLLLAVDAVRSKLAQPIPLGYCNAGEILESGVQGYSKGDRVVSNGSHAEVVRVAKNLCAKIPDNVDDESAAFTVLAAVGLQGIRLIKPTIGEAMVVMGLGLVGLMTVQMLRANGCRVLAIDYNKERCQLASEFGAEIVNLSNDDEPLTISKSFSRGRGVDGVIIALSSQSHEVIHQAAEMCRKRGRIVLVGVTGLNLRRDDFFKKELSFQVSSSYGPGRYDKYYENDGHDYPIGFVRWTEQRNFEAVLDLMATGVLNVKPLISHRFEISEALKAYEVLNDSSSLGIIIDYPEQDESLLRNSFIKTSQKIEENYLSSDAIVGFVGAGNYASRVLIPAFKNTGAKLHKIVSSAGLSGSYNGERAGFIGATTELDDLISDGQINTVVIATRHNFHASQVKSILESGKNVFVEKPLALNLKELEEIDKTYRKVSSRSDSSLRLMVGYNRRFAPHILKMKTLLQNKREPKAIIITINAGRISKDHWTQDPQIGGGRIIGEACHFVDLLRFLVGSTFKDYKAMSIGNHSSLEITDDKVVMNFSFEDGSIGTIHYLANGGKVFPKERIEVFCEDSVLQLDNYRSLRGYGFPGFKKMNLLKQDKGQNACAKAFIDSILQAKPSPITYDEIIESTKISILVADSLN